MRFNGWCFSGDTTALEPGRTRAVSQATDRSRLLSIRLFEKGGGVKGISDSAKARSALQVRTKERYRSGSICAEVIWSYELRHKPRTFRTPRMHHAFANFLPLGGISRTSQGSRSDIKMTCFSLLRPTSFCKGLSPPMRVGRGGLCSKLKPKKSGRRRIDKRVTHKLSNGICTSFIEPLFST